MDNYLKNMFIDEAKPALNRHSGGAGGGSSDFVDNGVIHEDKYRVRYFDVDGTILKIEYVESGGKLTPPSNPSYDPEYLTFEEWNYDIDNHVVEQPTDVGAIYNTVDNTTYLFCRFNSYTGLNPTLAVSGFTSIDWGDGTVDTNNTHTYATVGLYTIKIKGDISFTTSSSKYLLGSNSKNASLYKIYIPETVSIFTASEFKECRSLQVVSLPKTMTIVESSLFSNCCGIEHINVPKNVESIGSSSFNECRSLCSISLPLAINSIDSSAFYNCSSLEFVYISPNVVTISAQMFNNCNSLKDIILHDNITTIKTYAFNACYSLKKIKLPKNVSTIESYAFYNCSSITDYFIESTSVPTLANANAFSGWNHACIMWVNDELTNRFKSSTGWSTHSSRILSKSLYQDMTI